jgi:hypothetical protein
MASRGLQPICLVLAAVPSVLCVFVVALRVWTRWRSKKYDLGMFQDRRELLQTDPRTEDTLLVIATVRSFLEINWSGKLIAVVQALNLVLSFTTCGCKFIALFYWQR